MEKVTFHLPSIWADHHVLAVREVLKRIDGVQDVRASAMDQRVTIEYDPAQLTAEDLMARLVRAGYDPTRVFELPTYPKRIEDDSDWFRFQERITVTDMRDLEMSGDFRKY